MSGATITPDTGFVGTLTVPVTVNDGGVWAFVRDHADQQVLVVINVTGSAKNCQLDLAGYDIPGGATRLEGHLDPGPNPAAVPMPHLRLRGLSNDGVDLVDDFFDVSEQMGTKVELISPDSEEGEMLMKAFGGIAALLRYRIGG